MWNVKAIRNAWKFEFIFGDKIIVLELVKDCVRKLEFENKSIKTWTINKIVKLKLIKRILINSTLF